MRERKNIPLERRSLFLFNCLRASCEHVLVHDAFFYSFLMCRPTGMITGKPGYAACSLKGRIFMAKKKVLFLRPKDKSLEAYKAWVLALYEHLTGKREDNTTEEQWIAFWKAFWK